MFSKSIPASTITSTLLNSATGYTADATLDVPVIISNGVPRDRDNNPMYPKGIQILNKTGTDLEWVILSGDDDVLMFADPSNYPYFGWNLLPNNSVLANSNLPKCEQFIIRAVNASGATSGLRIDFNQYI